MTGSNDDSIVAPFEGVHVSSLFVCFCASVPGRQQAVRRIGQIQEILRKIEPTEEQGRTHKSMMLRGLFNAVADAVRIAVQG
jgi:hypothetical protein